MIKRKTIIEIVIVSVVGTLLHFVYDWSGSNAIVGIFGAVNESTWEHLKLLFWPMSTLTIVEYFMFYKNSTGFLLSRALATIIGMSFIVTMYYTVTGVVGKNIDAFNISLYFVSVILTFFLSKIFIKNKTFEQKNSNTIAAIVFFIFAVLFIVFTNNPPQIGIFREP
jgi:ABC-type Na+ efflux pump permease subunit